MTVAGRWEGGCQGRDSILKSLARPASFSLPPLSGPLQRTERKRTLSSGIINSPLYLFCQKNPSPLRARVRHRLTRPGHYFPDFVLANKVTKSHWSSSPFAYKP